MTVIKCSEDNHKSPYHVRDCPICQERMEKWINTYKLGDMCINCTQNMMRIIFENIIKYYNRKHVTLLTIFQHGNPEDEDTLLYWLEDYFPEFYPEMRELYDLSIKRQLRYERDHGKRFKKSKSKCCEICQKEIKNWINVYPKDSRLTGALCIDCAQYVMRTMFEDIIEYHNGVRVSLAEVMYYGEKKIDQMKEEEKQIEKPVAKYRDSSKLFDFDNEYDESGNNDC